MWIAPAFRRSLSSPHVGLRSWQNRQAWAKPGASVEERFNYLYGPSELKSWTERMRRLMGEAEDVHAVFNNCVRNFAILNAKGLAALLEQDLP